jgi:hypothetical protein
VVQLITRRAAQQETPARPDKIEAALTLYLSRTQLVCRRSAAVGTLVLLGAACTVAVAAPARYVRFGEAQPIIAALPGSLPAELQGLSDAARESAWPGWIERHDRDIRARLDQGDEDTIVNWMLFGTSFTDQPRALLGAVEGDSAADPEAVLRKTIALINARMEDLIGALAAPGADERRLFARGLLERRGLAFGTPAEIDRVREYLLGVVMRVAREQEAIDQDLAATTRRGDSIAEFVERSRLFRTRGLSLDTALLPNYAVEDSLREMKARGLLKPGEIRRIAIVGPGLDFADKDVGFDFYPQQTVQPFALLDSLKRLGLSATGGDPEIVLLDISPRVIDHVAAALARADRGEAYTINLPLPKTSEWSDDVRRYWATFGDQIGEPLDATPPAAIADQAELRAVRVGPAAVRRLSTSNVNIVTQRLDGEAFDLAIATNVFVYYDAFEQALALANIESMLKPRAFLLANFAAPPLGALTIRPVETRTTAYGRGLNQTENILDFMVWYQARAN